MYTKKHHILLNKLRKWSLNEIKILVLIFKYRVCKWTECVPKDSTGRVWLRPTAYAGPKSSLGTHSVLSISAIILRCTQILVEPEVVLRTGRFFSSRTLSWRHPNFGALWICYIWRKPNRFPMATLALRRLQAGVRPGRWSHWELIWFTGT